MKDNKKKLYTEPELRETVLECEDIITTSGKLGNYINNGTVTTVDSGGYVSVGSKSWGSIYSE